MTRPHLIAKLIFAAIGVHLLLHAISSISSIAAVSNYNYPRETIHLKIFFIILKLLFAFGVSLILLFRSDGLVRIIAGPDADQCEKVSSRWITAGFGVTACFCGLLILYHRIYLLSYYIPIIIKGPNISSYMTLQGQTSQFSVKILAGLIAETAQWIIAIYLIFGAPHYVRWQVRTSEAKQGVEI